MYGIASPGGDRCRLDAGNIARRLARNIARAKCDWTHYACVPDTEITSARQDVSAGAAGIGDLYICPGISITVIVDTWHYGCTAQIMDILDARFYQYGVVALVVYHSPGYTPPLSRVLNPGMKGSTLIHTDYDAY